MKVHLCWYKYDLKLELLISTQKYFPYLGIFRRSFVFHQRAWVCLRSWPFVHLTWPCYNTLDLWYTWTSRSLRVYSLVKCTIGHYLRQTYSCWWKTKDRLKILRYEKYFCVEIKTSSFKSALKTFYVPGSIALYYLQIQMFQNTVDVL